jgi:hypothetical protein
VLLVKQEDAHGDLRESEVFKPNAEVPQIACEQIGGCINPYLEDRPIATKGRDDPFIVDFVPWQFSAQRLESFVVRVRVMLRHKDPYSSENWKKMTVPDAEQK